MSKKKITIIILVTLFIIGLFIFRGGEPEEEKEITIVASFYPLYNLAEEIGGERTEVINLTSPGGDPRNLRLWRRNVPTIKEADIFLYNGAGLEPWMENIEEDLKEEDVIALNTSSYFRTIEREEGEDPHLWLDPLLFKEKTRIVLDKMIEADEEGEEYYRHNAKKVSARLEELHLKYRRGLDNCRYREVKVTDDVLGYLTQRHNFSATVADKDDKEAIDFNTAISPTTRELKDGENYFSIMLNNLEKLRETLDCRN